MTFLSPGRLWLLLVVLAFLIAYIVAQGLRKRYAVRFTNLSLLDQVAPKRPGWRRHIAAALFILMAAVMVSAFARPAAKVKVPRDRATIIVVIDVSRSMLASDVPPNRLEAAKAAAQRFVQGLPDRFNVGLVKFHTAASVLNSPTIDHQAVVASIGALRPEGSTAIGEAVFTSLEAIRGLDAQAQAKPPPAAIVLLSDGANTAGRPIDLAVAAARAQKVPVSTIAYGTDHGFIVNQGRRQSVVVDKVALRRLAESTGGKAYEAESAAKLDEVYKNIRTSIGYVKVNKEITPRFVGIALLLALGSASTSLLWSSRLP